MSQGSIGAGGTHHRAFFIWAAILSMVFGLLFIGVTALTIGLWLAHQNALTTPVSDLSFFALGAIIVGIGFAVQLRAPERKIAGVQQAVLGLLALGVAGLIGNRVEPLVGALLFLVAAAILAALHPARRACFKLGGGLSAPLAALSILAAVPAIGYAASMLVQARSAGPSCFLGRCPYGDRLAEMAALALINGPLEEMLWRGAFITLFPGQFWLGLLYPRDAQRAFNSAIMRSSYSMRCFLRCSRSNHVSSFDGRFFSRWIGAEGGSSAWSGLT